MLAESENGYRHATLLDAIEAGHTGACRLRLEDEAGEEAEKPAHQLRAPLACGAALGRGGALEVGAEVYAVRGQWLEARTLDGGARGGLHHVELALGGRTAQVWVSGGQLVPRLVPADPAAALPGAHVVAVGDEISEGLLGAVGDDGVAVVVTPAGAEIEVAADALRLRLDAAFRVVAPVGGWQTGTLSEVSSEGLYRVKLAGGVERWATAEQIIAVHSAADGADLADGILAAVLPSADVELAAARWLPAAVVRGAADDSAAADGDGAWRLQRPGGGAGAAGAARQPLLQATLRKVDGKFGLNLDDSNVVASVVDGSAAAEAGLATGDEVVTCDGAPLAGTTLTAAAEGKELLRLGVRPAAEREAAAAAAAAAEWSAPASRLRLPLHSRAAHARQAVAVGDAVLVQTGGWREAVVEEQDDAGFYLLGFGDGERRWAREARCAGTTSLRWGTM